MTSFTKVFLSADSIMRQDKSTAGEWRSYLLPLGLEELAGWGEGHPRVDDILIKTRARHQIWDFLMVRPGATVTVCNGYFVKGIGRIF